MPEQTQLSTNNASNDDTGKTIVLVGIGITGFLELLIASCCCYLWVTGKDLPKGLGEAFIGVTVYAFTTIPAQTSDYLKSIKKV